MTRKQDPELDFGKYAGKQISEVPQYYLAWIVGYTSIGSPSIILPKEQSSEKKTNFSQTVPNIYYAALEELVKRNLCLVCNRPLVSFKSCKDWRTRLLHKKCYYEHMDENDEEDECME